MTSKLRAVFRSSHPESGYRQAAQGCDFAGILDRLGTRKVAVATQRKPWICADQTFDDRTAALRPDSDVRRGYYLVVGETAGAGSTLSFCRSPSLSLSLSLAIPGRAKREPGIHRAAFSAVKRILGLALREPRNDGESRSAGSSQTATKQPDGQISEMLSSPLCKNISVFRKPKSGL
jgi:hypothetical protein